MKTDTDDQLHSKHNTDRSEQKNLNERPVTAQPLRGLTKIISSGSTSHSQSRIRGKTKREDNKSPSNVSGTMTPSNNRSKVLLNQLGIAPNYSQPGNEDLEEVTTELIHLKTEMLRMKSFYKPIDQLMELMSQKENSNLLNIITQHVYS